MYIPADLERERASINTGKTIRWDFQIDEFHSSILQVKEQKINK